MQVTLGNDVKSSFVSFKHQLYKYRMSDQSLHDALNQLNYQNVGAIINFIRVKLTITSNDQTKVNEIIFQLSYCLRVCLCIMYSLEWICIQILIMSTCNCILKCLYSYVSKLFDIHAQYSWLSSHAFLPSKHTPLSQRCLKVACKLLG